MDDFNCRKNPIHVSRDAGYNKIESISLDNSQKSGENLNNDGIVSRICLLDELYTKMGVIVHPEKMTNWYAFQ